MARIRVYADSEPDAERAAAEAYAAGAVGLEELATAGGPMLILYAPLARAASVARALTGLRGLSLRVESPEPVPEQDWSEAWKAGLDAVEISPRLRIRPSFVSARPAPGQLELVIDPGQAFGVGGHASTRLALEWIDALAREPGPAGRVLDVGTGTGVLALAALRLGWPAAVALDLDPRAVAEARAHAVANELSQRLLAFAGGLAALAPAPFELVVANLLEREMLPLLDELAARTAAGGHLVLSGLLASERDHVVPRLARAGLRLIGERTVSDADGLAWCALLTTR
jgi:ribosomal protein L11 methyltransferase